MEDVRVYGDFHRISPEIYDKIKDLCPFEQVDYDGDVLRVDHEGKYILIDDFIEAIRDLLPENGYGHVEFIDQLDWTVTRYTIKPGKIEEKLVRVDNVLDAHQRENGL
jgi:DNA-dependent RNA polymerase auxiliary subunit epsilon